MQLPRGSRLGTYEILDLLGAGGMGEVYRARDLRLSREVALKVLAEGVAASPEGLARFEREARTVAGLNHPNIVTLYSVEEEGNVRFLTMELIQGQDLVKINAPCGLPLDSLLDLAIPLSDAIVAAHERGIVHRDLKPGNVMVTPEGRVKVLDFGLAKSTGTAERAGGDTRTAGTGASISGHGQILGTVPYMAPEQIRGEAVDARSDIFALGVILYELATGRRPFGGDTPADVCSSILRDVPEPLSVTRIDLPDDLDRIIGRCLEKERRNRFQTALDVCNELRRLKGILNRGAVAPRRLAHDAASIAVLPFVNRSNGEEDEYFSDGLADELLNTLARVPGLKVAARSSAFAFKGRSVAAAEVGRVLKVATVLEGSVRKAGSRVRISVQLVNATDGYHLWSDSYDRTLDDIFAVQDDIARSVVAGLRNAVLIGAAGSGLSASPTLGPLESRATREPNPEAYRHVLQGRHLVGRGTAADLGKGIGHFEAAVRLDPGYARAWRHLGGAYATEADQGLIAPAKGYARAREALQRALELDPDLADGHASLGWVKMRFERDLRGAEASLLRAKELAPGDWTALSVLAVLARMWGRLDEAIELHERCCELDPVSSNSYHNLAQAYHAAGRMAEAEGSYRTALELSPRRETTRALLATALAAVGRDEGALAEASREPDEASRLWALAVIHGMAGRLTDSDEALRQLTDRYGDQEPYAVAQAFATRGDVDSAFEWLDRAYKNRVGGLMSMRANPRLHALHDDPRWLPMLKRLALDG